MMRGSEFKLPKRSKLQNVEKAMGVDKETLNHHWSRYFPTEQDPIYNKEDTRQKIAHSLYFRFCYPNFYQKLRFGEERAEKMPVYISVGLLREIGSNTVDDLLQTMHEQPYEVIGCFSLAIEHMLKNLLGMENPPKVNLRVMDVDESIKFQIHKLKSHLLNRLVGIRGSVLRVGSVSLYIHSCDFRCVECGRSESIGFSEGRYEVPKSCRGSSCRGRKFEADKRTAKTSFMQRIKIQDIECQMEAIHAGKMPKSMECEVKDDLVDSCQSGDIVSITGVLKPEIEGRGAKGPKFANLFASYIDARSLFKEQSTDNFISGKGEVFSKDEIREFEKLRHRYDLFPLLIKSVCPSIYGHELVKAGLVLSLFGGSDVRGLCKSKGEELGGGGGEGEHPHQRSDIHVLIVGDPGMGKSLMLRHIVQNSPRGVYVCGKGSTSAGLTLTIVRDPLTAEHTIEAGALVLSDCGVCCIDEFDKMLSEHNALLEAMQQQTVSIAKSGVICTLPARCSVVASANPASGHYDTSKSILENIKVSNAVLSRFDLVFLLLDQPDEMKDKFLSDHIMKLHSKGNTTIRERQTLKNKFMRQTNKEQQKPFKRGKYENNENSILGKMNNLHYEEELDYDEESLAVRLARETEDVETDDIITSTHLKRYIMYIKSICYPRLSSEAARVVKEYWLNLRIRQENMGLNITPRQLTSLIRLSQARAKLEGRNLVTEKDASETCQLFDEAYFNCLHFDELEKNSSLIPVKGMKKVDLSNIGQLSQAKQTKIFINRIGEIVEGNSQHNKNFSFNDLMKEYKSMKMNVDNFENFIEGLNNKAVFLKKANKTYDFIY